MKIILHVGPPKTGTSALQAWFINNREYLSSHGVDYPKHKLDENNVSSGNYLSLMSKNTRDQYQLDREKISKLLQDFSDSAYHTLLLSSEHFDAKLIELTQHMPFAEFVFYIRHPLSILESGYHQHVKRHQKAELFSLPAKITFNRTFSFLKLSKEFNVKFIPRFYEPSLLEGNSLVDDFCKVIKVPLPPQTENKRVNKRYGFGELEFMRFCNVFISKGLGRQLDKCLQKHSDSKSRFTLISEDDTAFVKQCLLASCESQSALINMVERSGSNDFVSKIKNLAQLEFSHPYKHQSDSNEDISNIWLKLKQSEIVLSRNIYKEYCHAIKQGVLSEANAENFGLTWRKKDSMRLIAQVLSLGLLKT
jgi:hypothetical protein